MASFDADIIRMVGLELQERVRLLYLDTLTMYRAIGAWTLNGIDPGLPTPFDVRVQIESYENLEKKDLRLREWIAQVKQAQPDDYLSYPEPPVYFDGGGGYFDGGGAPEEEP